MLFQRLPTLVSWMLALLAFPLVAAAQPASPAGQRSAPGASARATRGSLPQSTSRQGILPQGAPHHIIGQPATVFSRPDSAQPYLEAGFREPLYLLDKGPRWSHVRTADGAKGYVRSHAISNVWVHVSKRDKRVYLYEGTRRVMAAPADFGYNAFLDKEQRGSQLRRDDWRTPEGTLYVVRKNPNSQFHRALVLNYPTAEDAARGLASGLISEAEHREIVEAQEALRPPPMGTALGGMIEIHGQGTGEARNWTRGCVALHNRDLRKMWNRVEVGTPVVIE